MSGNGKDRSFAGLTARIVNWEVFLSSFFSRQGWEYVEINGGNISVKPGDEGIAAETSVTITGGTVLVETENNGIKAEELLKIDGGTVKIITDDGLKYEAKQITPNAVVTVNGIPVS